ncbi:type II toxin-antitoxin system RelE family toxin [Spirulina sp. 06S082]|uniref:type II toxin-antitoxin system RelE family toxin n=1 Tax=Spirulina sp. 06S082 TaxID=3110248 RepID=UPI002B2082FB|nr:type II toxin-antitoxin system RelE/ParE family toxin [Spirulina sp. 06S082]MEA5467912.1 type II toxin-antitoxin system RelE/ParE family toxin [Spirulina sp. 06S082]
MSMNKKSISIELTPRFKKRLKQLAKRYRSIQKDIEPLITELQTGKTPGNQIQGLSYPVFKARVKNSDTKTGKSGGYRVIYYIQSPTGILLLTIYSKSDQSDVSSPAIEDIIRQYQS